MINLMLFSVSIHIRKTFIRFREFYFGENDFTLKSDPYVSLYSCVRMHGSNSNDVFLRVVTYNNRFAFCYHRCFI
jgi:hypothetical protein